MRQEQHVAESGRHAEAQHGIGRPTALDTWQVLDANSIWIREFASALGGLAPVTAWVREMSLTGMFRSKTVRKRSEDPPLDLVHFPLQRGYTNALLAGVFDRVLADRLRQQGAGNDSPLICTTPYYAPVAERWRGPVVYYLTDLTKAYAGADPSLVRRMDVRMCRVATLVCPNSRRIAEYLREEAGCRESKITVVPNATRRANVFATPPREPSEPPQDLAGLPRPLIGVMGNLAANLDWALLRDTVRMNPGCSWAFVGPTDMAVEGQEQQLARQALQAQGGNVVFTGAKPYGRLRDYARCFDAALLPYQQRKEPTYSGSSTRFYEHLAACRPMIATHGFEELLHKGPLLRLADSAGEVTSILEEWRRNGFRDGWETARWQASQEGTWEKRALTMRTALDERLGY